MRGMTFTPGCGLRARTLLRWPVAWAWFAVLAVVSAGRIVYAAEPLRLAAAADLQPVLPAILTGFKSQTGIEVEATYQSSATLATQIENGAGFDVFMAADLSFPERVIAAGLAEQGAPIVYARGTLVLWGRKDAPVVMHAGGHLTLDVLNSPELRTLAVANPEHAPYGRAAKAALTSMGLLPAIAPKLVTAENIAQTAQYVSTGNAELGLISLTSALTPQMQAAGVYVEVPRADYPVLEQGAITMKRSTEHEQAHKLLEYLATPAVRQALVARGLASPQ
jgi:molybdate transport system substrate-binding protein